MENRKKNLLFLAAQEKMFGLFFSFFLATAKKEQKKLLIRKFPGKTMKETTNVSISSRLNFSLLCFVV